MALRHFLLGRRCVFCAETIDPQEESGMCKTCAERLSEEDLYSDGTEAGTVYLFVYRSIVRDAVHRFKYGGDKEFGRFCGARLAALCREQNRTADLVTCVPRAMDEAPRVYNQSEVLAKAFAGELHVPFDPNLIAKKNGVRPQTECSSRRMRRKNVKNAFYAGSSARDLTGKTVFLADDVFTTGSTVRACASVLRKRGAARVAVFTAARTQSRRFCAKKFRFPIDREPEELYFVPDRERLRKIVSRMKDCPTVRTKRFLKG